MLKLLTLIFVFLLIIAGCSSDRDKKPDLVSNETELKELAEKAASGDNKANDSLSLLFDSSIPSAGEPNKFIAREFISPDGSKYFYILLEYPNPVYNRFAVYDSLLNLRLMNKNLNGFLNVELLNINDIEFIQIKESFLAKDVIKINKMHMIMTDTAGVHPVLEIYSSIITPKEAYTHTIFDFNSNYIGTRIAGPDSLSENIKEDVFIFDLRKKRYISTENIFQQKVLEIIEGFEGTTKLPEIKDSASASGSLSLNASAGQIENISNAGGKQGFNLTLNEGWKEVNNLVLSEHLKKRIRGTRFINTTLGSEISVLPIPFNSASEEYISYSFNSVAEGTYRVRYSDKIELEKDYIQYFEYSCGSKKYLMIFETSKYNYEGRRDIYEKIVNSFSMEC